MGLGVYIELTNACNLNCKHCLPSSAKPRKGELTTQEIIDLLGDFRKAGAESVFFTGGEPFLRPDFSFILGTCKDLGFTISIVTNGTLADDFAISLLKQYEVTVSISLDGATADIHDHIRGKGMFDKTITTLHKLTDMGVRVETAFTVNHTNFDHISKIAEMSKSLGCWRVLYTEVVGEGRAKDNWGDLALTPEERSQLPLLVEKVAKEVFGDDHFGFDDRCWVDGSSIFIDSTGLAYSCVEVFQRRKDFAIANVKTESEFNKVIAILKTQHTHRPCCYELYASKNVTLIANLDRSCAVVDFMEQKPTNEIQNIEQLKSEFEKLWTGIEKSCANCSEPDCIGYIWVMPEEEDVFLEAGARTVQINGSNGAIFIDSYPRDQHGALIVNQSKPPCPYRSEDGCCSIHSHRPLVCHLYPLGLETTADGRIVWGLHTDCAHVHSLIDQGHKETIIYKIKEILGRMNSHLRAIILQEYTKVDALSTFPDGVNNYLIVEELLP
jgi:MoaA/NifB/PqqE/SkfB family radical SAM enzyme/Fe-S-cluster containining protein